MAKKTVAEVIVELSKLPLDAEVMTSIHYDNDNALSEDIAIYLADVSHSEAHFWSETDPQYGQKKVVVIHG